MCACACVCFGNMRPCQWRLQQLMKTHRDICRMPFYSRGWCFSTALHKIMPPFSINTPSEFWASKPFSHICTIVCDQNLIHIAWPRSRATEEKKLNIYFDIHSDVRVFYAHRLFACFLLVWFGLNLIVSYDVHANPIAPSNHNKIIFGPNETNT